jgi:VWFA-related protein
VPVLALGRQGHVEGLAREQFQLLVDGQLVPSEAFEIGGEAIGVLLALDRSGSMGIGNKLELARLAVEYVTAGLTGEDRASLVAFSDAGVELLVPFDPLASVGTKQSSPSSTRHELLRERAEELAAQGVTALRDALVELPRLASASTSSHRAVLLLTDGVDNASLLTQAEVRAALSEAAVPLYIVDLGSGVGQRRRAEDGKSLRDVASASGGRYLAATHPADIHRIARLFLEETRNRYVLGFSTAPGAGRSDHSIVVKIAIPTRELRYRSRYFGSRPAAATAPPSSR